MVKLSHQFHGTTPSGWLIKVLKLYCRKLQHFDSEMVCVCVFMGYLTMWWSILSIILPNIQWYSMTFYLLSLLNHRYQIQVLPIPKLKPQSQFHWVVSQRVPNLCAKSLQSKGLGYRAACPSELGFILASFVWYKEDFPSYNGWLSMSILQGVQFQKYHKWLSRKGLDPEFEFKKLGFVQEACGKQQEEHVVNAQSTVNNARKNSLAAAFNLFATNLTNDQCLQDKFLAMAEMTNSRARSVLIHGLEAFWVWWPSSRNMGNILG